MPPRLTATSRLLSRLANAAADLSRLQALLYVTVVFAGVVALELAMSVRATLIIAYALVTLLAAWTLGERGGYVTAFLATVVDAAIRHVRLVVEEGVSPDIPTEIWNAVTRLATLALVVVLVTGMRSAFALERWRASVDALTGALNYGAFSRIVAPAMSAARVAGDTVILAVMDLDGFKRVNDTHGHAAGDAVLKNFAEAAGRVIRRDDLFARIGGDEFIALLRVHSVAEAEAVATMFHARLTGILAEDGLGVSVSMGALILDGSEIDMADSHADLADHLMYEVKRSGKNALRLGRLNVHAPKPNPDVRSRL